VNTSRKRRQRDADIRSAAARRSVTIGGGGVSKMSAAAAQRRRRTALNQSKWLVIGALQISRDHERLYVICAISCMQYCSYVEYLSENYKVFVAVATGVEKSILVVVGSDQLTTTTKSCDTTTQPPTTPGTLTV